VVLDEVPYLTGHDDAFEGVLQRSWDRLLERKPVLLLLIGVGPVDDGMSTDPIGDELDDMPSFSGPADLSTNPDHMEGFGE